MFNICNKGNTCGKEEVKTLKRWGVSKSTLQLTLFLLFDLLT